jgi:hypothetical protein
MIVELRSQDIVVVLKLLLPSPPRNWTYANLGKELFMSPSQVFRSVERAAHARLLDFSPPPPDPGRIKRPLLGRPNRGNLKEFLIHGVKYAFPAQRGGLTRGVPTAEGAPPLSKHLVTPPFPPVWPLSEGSVRGTEFSPLYKNEPKAALQDPRLYELLALVDAIRDGRAREREIAVRELTSRIDLEP